MSKKQEIYKELMRYSMPMVRNMLTHRFIYGHKKESIYFLSELTHNLYVSILDEEFGDHDLHILNVQARWYYENASNHSLYELIVPLLQALFDIVPSEYQDKLKWSIPKYSKKNELKIR